MAKSKSSRSSTKVNGKLPVTVDKDSSIHVRQIENGYVVSESGTTGKGKNQQYYSREYFSKSNPVKINGATPTSGNIRFNKK